MELITIFCFRHCSLTVPAIRPSFKVKISFINHLSHFILNHPSPPHPPWPPSCSLTNYHPPTHFTVSNERDPLRGCVNIPIHHRRGLWWDGAHLLKRRTTFGVGEASGDVSSSSESSSHFSSSSRRWIGFVHLLHRFIGHRLFIFVFYRVYLRP